MKKIKLIYNPVSGDGSFKYELDLVVSCFQNNNHLVELFRINKDIELEKFFKEPINEKSTTIVVAGGDGTVNAVVNAMMKNNIQAPLGVIPTGTANDLGSYLGMPRNLKECCRIIIENYQIKMDVGKINEDYFISVASGGLLASVPHSTDVRLKNTLGKLGYYLKGLEELPSFRPISVSLHSPDYNFEGNLLFFLILNSQFAGGFKKIAPKARIHDGKFDVILFKECTLPVIAILFLKVLRGEHIYDPNVVFFQTSELTIESLSASGDKIGSDVDGEAGPSLPLSIRIEHQALNMILPKERGTEL